MDGPKNNQQAVHRATEGTRPGKTMAASHSANPRPRGRPPGSRNKPKGIVPVELANQILVHMKAALPEEHYEYLRGVIREGKAISTKTELDTLILLLSRNLYPALILEATAEPEVEESVDTFFDDESEESDEEKKPAKPKKKGELTMPVFRKDVTERLKVLQGLLSLRNQVEKRDSDSKDEEKPVLRIFAGRGIDLSRFRVLVGVESGAVVGDTDGVGQPSDEARTVSGEVLERQELLPAGEQGSPDWVFDSNRSGGAIQRRDETVVQG